MNFLYFACPICKTYTCAGYRWAYWHLQHPGHVEVNKPVNVAEVLQARTYWNPPVDAESTWLYDGVFPTVRRFLTEHCDHGMLFVDSGDFFALDDFDSWVEIENS